MLHLPACSSTRPCFFIRKECATNATVPGPVSEPKRLPEPFPLHLLESICRALRMISLRSHEEYAMHRHHVGSPLRLSLATALALASGAASASGFALLEQS